MKKISKLKKSSSNICKKLTNNTKHIIYLLVFICGVGLIALSFAAEKNWQNVCSGVGTGLLTSLTVSVIINAENNAREKRKQDEEKRFVLNDIIENSIDIYEDVIHRINEFITLTDVGEKSVYKLYEDFKSYNSFEEQLKKVVINKAPDEIKNRLNTLFNFNKHTINYLVAELRRLPKKEYYLRGILTQEECRSLVSNFASDSYFEYAAHIQDFWDIEIKDLGKCIQFLRIHKWELLQGASITEEVYEKLEVQIQSMILSLTVNMNEGAFGNASTIEDI